MTIYSGFFPLKIVMFHSFLYVYQRVGLVFPMETPNFGESKGNGGLG
jgi:hypothetical protein